MRNALLGSATALALVAATPAPLRADASDAQVAAVIDEGLNRSEAMVTASQLMDGIGPRLTNSQNYRRAADWATARMAAIGLQNVHREGFDFGLGWNIESYRATMVSPRRIDLMAIPVAWSPPTDGVLRAGVVVAPMSKVEHFAAWKGKLAGKVVMISLPGATSESTKPVFQRFDDKQISEYDRYDLPSFDPATADRRAKRTNFPLELSRFLKAEGALAMIRISYRDGMLVHGEGYNYRPGETLALPAFEVAAEDYRRLVRLAAGGPAPEIELQLNARFDDSTLQAENLFGDITGSDPKAGYVMAGAHFDSWIAGDGAADNGAGSVVVLEAARILQRLGVKPRRTIRFALWAGEEQGLLGSRAYIERYLATRPVDPKLTGIAAYSAWSQAWPIAPKPGYAELKAYFNLDNGGGKVRGIYAENNIAAEPMLKKWLSPFEGMGASRVVTSKTGGTDHVYLQAIGLPGYQFIQDPLDYDSRVHHSNLDTLDHLRGDDLRQAATIMAAMLLQAANSDKDLPRMPLPSKPVPTDPFKVRDPDE
ncbi:M20/M25/M40 family metallo-hydrolase [Novosphingobium ginsenosidimutans]|uniref:Carboxypeptidase Q n=1 Tax=Novosphingobium ginsenosidimutans TaxID=1176536 RepID=A0A5B8S9V8_9SPHN|nr:M20/M25/M40 family metallo-hydrolase [Novosphingobium ginsenosidimutans]